MNNTKQAIGPSTKKMRFQNQSGFTLIEILVVMAIIAMLALAVVPNIFPQREAARRNFVLGEIATLEGLLESYNLDVGEYPDSLEGLVENDTGRASWNGPYLPGALPTDPWGNDYLYDSAGGRDFTLISYGGDGEQGGEDDDADIGL